ncbi:MAG: hypothetical protein IJ752_01725 [Alphaproteobacteria bacterium]|nr:hypothetical protein [Alphaproteobacteria bacterium]
MSRGKRSNKERIGGKFIALPFNLIQSRAFAELTGSAKGLLVCILTRYTGTNNGTIPFGYSDGAAFGFTVNTTKCAIVDLWNKGFIKRTKEGVYRGNVSEWLLTFRRDDRNGHARTDDWKQYPNNAKDAELIALLKTKSGDKNDGDKKRPTEANDNAPAPVIQNASADSHTNELLQSLENWKRKQGLL